MGITGKERERERNMFEEVVQMPKRFMNYKQYYQTWRAQELKASFTRGSVKRLVLLFLTEFIFDYASTVSTTVLPRQNLITPHVA